MQDQIILGTDKTTFTHDGKINLFAKVTHPDDTPKSCYVEIEILGTEISLTIPSNRLESIVIPSHYFDNQNTKMFVVRGYIEKGQPDELYSEIEFLYQCKPVYDRELTFDRVHKEAKLFNVIKGLLWTTLTCYSNDPDERYTDLFGIRIFNDELRFGVNTDTVSLTVLKSQGEIDFTPIGEIHIGHDRAQKLIEEGKDFPAKIIVELLNHLLTHHEKLFLNESFYNEIVRNPVTSDFNYHYVFMKHLAESALAMCDLNQSFKMISKSSF